MKKVLVIMLTLIMTFSMAACGGGSDSSSDVKIGVILIGDENEGYTYAHIDGIKKAAEKVGISEDQIIWKYTIGEDETCLDAAKDLADQGCTTIFSNSYGHQSYMASAAEEYPDVTFVAVTGDTAAVSGLDNFKNAFNNIYESRYVSGVVAGMKLAELDKQNKLTDKNFDADGKVKIGYVGAYPYAEVVSGYTAFYQGIKSVYENVSMDVQYTNSWFDITAEGEAANALMARGCVIIGQHSDSTGPAAAVQAALKDGKTAYSVGYNIDMLSVAPDAALVSATNNWEVYYEYALGCAVNGEEIDVNWTGGYNEGAVATTELGESCAKGTQEKVDEAVAGIKDGSIKVFDTSKFTVGGKAVTSHEFDSSIIDFATGKVIMQGEKYETIEDGAFSESKFRSAPYFDLRIDGITELNAK